MEKVKYSQLQAMLAITKASLRSIMRSPSAIVFTLVFPLIFILVFGLRGNSPFKVKIGIDPSSDKSSPVYENVLRVPVLSIVQDVSSEEMQKQLSKGELDAVLFISKNPARSKFEYTSLLKTSGATPDDGQASYNILRGVMSEMNFVYARVPHPLAELKQQEIPGREYKAIDFILPGMLGFSLLSSGVFGTAFVFFNLRQTLVLKRFFATPIKRIYIVLGEAVSRMIFSVSGALLLILLGKYAFGFTLIHGFFTAVNMLILSALGLIVFMGFGFVVSGIAKSESTIPPLANIITLPQFLLAGTFFSIEALPGWLQPLCKILPLTYLNDAMRKVSFEGASLVDVAMQIGIVSLWGIIIYALAARVFRWE